MDEMTFEEWQAYWYRKNEEIFGEAKAREFMLQDLEKDTAMKELWMAKGFKTVGEYVTWEKDHMEERNEFFRKRGAKL